MQNKNPEADHGFTPLHEAASSGHLDISELIIGDDFGYTPLHLATIHGHFDICKLIIGNIQNKNPVAHNGQTPLLLAAEGGYFDI